ncbi:MAG TPA: hypothetical protein VFU81_12345, partial [Thermomicrobiales bacterium]|nr:hypothetical protein [Thermomicrobiales bacterium]
MVETVKKIGLSLSVIVLFALYAMQKQARPLAGVGTIAASAPSASPAVVAAAPDLAFWSAAPHDVPIGTAIATATPPTAASTADLAMAPSDAAVATARNETPTSTPTPSFAGFAATTAPAGRYRDGTYDGGVADANWGEVAVQAIIAGG